MTELKPCPFCGGCGVRVKHYNINRPVKYGVYCPTCGANSKLSEEQKTADDAWNRRVTNERYDSD